MKPFKLLSSSVHGIAIAMSLSGSANADSLVDNTLATWKILNNGNIQTWSSYNQYEQKGMGSPLGSLTLPPPPAQTSNSQIMDAWDINDVNCNGLIDCHSSNSGASTTANVVAGQTYTLSFYEAAVDRYYYGPVPTIKDTWASGAKIGWDVTLGGQSITTHEQSGIQTPAPAMLTGWTYESITFVASATGSEVLQFIGDSTPAVLPEPVIDLACVNLVSGSAGADSCILASVPEPGMIWMLLTGLTGLAVANRRARKS